MSTYTVKVNSNERLISYGSFMQIADDKLDLGPDFVELNCWAVATEEIEVAGKTEETPLMARLTGGKVEAVPALGGPPPPTIKPRPGGASLIFVKGFDTTTRDDQSRYATFKGGPANVFIMAWGDKEAPLSIDALEGPLVTVTQLSKGQTQYHVYNIEDPDGKHPFHRTTIAIPVPVGVAMLTPKTPVTD